MSSPMFRTRRRLCAAAILAHLTPIAQSQSPARVDDSTSAEQLKKLPRRAAAA